MSASAAASRCGASKSTHVRASACSAAASPITDRRGTADYRRRVVGVLARRAAGSAIARARGDEQ